MLVLVALALVALALIAAPCCYEGKCSFLCDSNNEKSYFVCSAARCGRH